MNLTWPKVHPKIDDIEECRPCISKTKIEGVISNELFALPQALYRNEAAFWDNAILEIHDDFDIHTGSHIVIDPGAKLSLGKGGMNNNVRIAAFKSITIGHNVYISENATLWDSDNHPIGASSKNISAPITIGDNVLIGLNATILKGVTIGDGAVVAANSLVIRSVPPKALVGGAPAKVLRENVKWSL